MIVCNFLWIIENSRRLLLRINIYCHFFQKRCNNSSKRADSSKLIYIICIIVFEFVKAMNEKLHFTLDMINLSIKSCFSIFPTFLLSFNLILIARLNYSSMYIAWFIWITFWFIQKLKSNIKRIFTRYCCYDSVILAKRFWQRYETRIDEKISLDRRLPSLSIITINR